MSDLGGQAGAEDSRPGEARRAAEPVPVASYLAGEWSTGSGAEQADTSPACPSEVVATYRLIGDAELERALDSASNAFARWRLTPMHERARVLAKAADLLEEQTGALAVELTREQGKTLPESHAELTRAAEILRFNASLATAEQGRLYASPRAGEQIWTLHVPLGPVAIITPWNVPIAIPAWKIAPALLYGNTVVWKPARLVPLLAFRLMQALVDAGLPAGVCNLVLGDASIGERLLSDRRIRACSFTGSTEVGRRLAAFGAQHGVKVQAEMGGKNAALVFEDADLEWAADQVLSAAMHSAGQRCTATSRALVAHSRYDDFVAMLSERTQALRVGDPLDPETQVGPLASSGQRRQVLDYYRAAREQGGEILAGGDAIEDASGGYYVQPTVAVGVRPEHRVFEEEIFGPLVAVLPFDSEAEALALANRGPYGLAAAVFSRDIERVQAVVEGLDVGVLHVNSESCGADPHVPFGGMKDSGTAHREMGTAAQDFYTELKTVYLRPGRRD